MFGIPGFVLRPPVLGRAAVPVVTDPAEAARRPELAVLAVLAAMAHGASELGAAIALPASQGLEEERARFYGDLVYNALNDAARQALEAMMKGYEYQSDFARKYVAQGRAEGEATARARDVLTVLQVRGIAVPEAARERILAQNDPARLEGWLEKAALAVSVADVLDELSLAAWSERVAQQGNGASEHARSPRIARALGGRDGAPGGLRWRSRGRHVHRQHTCSGRALAYVGRGPASAVRGRGASWDHPAALGAGGATG